MCLAARRRLDAVVVFGEANIRSLTGVVCDNGCLLLDIAGGRRVVFYTDFRYVPMVHRVAPWLRVRETRRVMGDAMVVDGDLLEGRKYDDAVVHDAWFLIDIHNPKGGGQAEGHSHPAKPYDIRYGAFLPKGIDGLLTAGRCISGTHRAHASYRVMTPCMAMGEAVGVAAALAAKRGITPRAVSAAEVREVLKQRGVKL